MVVARMTHDKAELLKSQAGARLVVEQDTPLTYGLDPGPLAAADPGILIPLAEGFKTTIEVQGPQGPLQDADVFVFGGHAAGPGHDGRIGPRQHQHRRVKAPTRSGRSM